MTLPCPRRVENPIANTRYPPEKDHWHPDNSCSYCGSLNPDVFMSRLEAGDVKLIPTDKRYKAYLRNTTGEPFKQHYRDCPKDATCKGPDDCTHWVTRETSETKFYFQHLSEPQIHRLIELVNQKKINFAEPGYFYVLPYFARPREPGEA